MNIRVVQARGKKPASHAQSSRRFGRRPLFELLEVRYVLAVTSNTDDQLALTWNSSHTWFGTCFHSVIWPGDFVAIPHGLLGCGWTTPWETFLSFDDVGNATIHSGVGQRSVTRHLNGTYRAASGDYARLLNVNGPFVRLGRLYWTSIN